MDGFVVCIVFLLGFLFGRSGLSGIRTRVDKLTGAVGSLEAALREQAAARRETPPTPTASASPAPVSPPPVPQAPVSQEPVYASAAAGAEHPLVLPSTNVISTDTARFTTESPPETGPEALPETEPEATAPDMAEGLPEQPLDLTEEAPEFTLEEDAAPEHSQEEPQTPVYAPKPMQRPAPQLPGFVRLVVDFVKGGNIWAAGGVLMLLLGFGFLLTYMAERGMFSVELRIALAALCGMAMVAIGLRLRAKRPMYALILQGGGIGVLYLCAFAAAKITTLLPPAAALVLMVLLIIPAVALALLQKAQVLALFGFFGGFAAPILLSDGSGNYVALFSCYTLLNLGLLAIARFRLWRWLNLLGAVCTFVVMGAWGVRSYTVDKFSTVEPFLLGFCLIFVAITLLSVRRREFSFAHAPDAVLALGIPFVSVLFQWRLAVDLPHGLSVSAVAFGAFFILLAAVVWRLWGESMRRLAEYYLASGVMLANLAVPLEISGSLTSSVWAAEGALLFFFACRSASWRIKIVALIMQAAGMMIFLWEFFSGMGHTLLPTSILALSFLASACLQQRDAVGKNAEEGEDDAIWPIEGGLERVLAFIGLFWWFGGLALECFGHAAQPWPMLLGAVSVSAALLYEAGRRLDFADLRLGAGVPLAVAWLVLGASLARNIGLLGHPEVLLTQNLFAGWGGPAWLLFACGQVFCLWRGRDACAPKLHAAWAGLAALELLLACSSSGRALAYTMGLARAWVSFAGLLPPLAYILALVGLFGKPGRDLSQNPLRREHARVLLGYVPALLFAALGLWLARSLFAEGSPRPLPVYVPLLNPLEIKQALCIAVFVLWQTVLRKQNVSGLAMAPARLVRVADILVFIWLHSLLFRSVHWYTGLPMSQVWSHGALQTALTVLWAVWGTAHIIVGNKFAARPLWVIGAALVTADTAKLFLLDFADKGTLFRIISFFVVGGIFLLIGWLAPLPPAAKKPGPGAPEDPDGGGALQPVAENAEVAESVFEETAGSTEPLQREEGGNA